jgi:hypothetical protein
MAGALYLWIMLALALGIAAVITLFIAILWFGHWFEKKSTGTTHGFLEVPPGAESRPATPARDPPPRDSPHR